MDSSYPDVSSLWDLSQPTTFSHLPDDDLMAMLQKQFPLVPSTTNSTQTAQSRAAGGFPDGVNPQNISHYSLSSLTPESEDSSPSPPETGSQDGQNADDTGGGGGPTNHSRRVSMGDSVLKRKASDADYSDEGPSQKTQHTSLNDKKGTASSPTGSRRKSTGGVAKDEGRLLKRKEQNRAAQRAFRERKEKHVKDLEDKVAELETKNEVAQSENENLRDLLSRLQSENVMLKQSNFTFTMTPKSQQPDSAVSAPRHFSPENSVFSASPSSTVISPETLHQQPKSSNLLDWTSLTNFDPNILNLLDESPQTTATSSAMNLDIFAPSTETNNSLPFTTIASNPMFMSFASNFDTMLLSPDNSTSIGSGNGSDNAGRSGGQPFSFDLNSLSSWPTPTPPTQENASMDDLFAGYLNPTQNSEFSPFTATPSISPVTHKATVTNTDYTNLHNSNFSSFLPTPSGSSLSSSGSSPSSQSTTSSEPSPSTPKESQSTNGTADPDHPMGTTESASDPAFHKKTGCPKTKSELVQRIAAAGASPFAPSILQKSSDNNMGSMVSCAGSKFPRTAQSDKNVEVLSAWRSITSDPMFKDANIDINNLCSEFTSKAKCDGTKVVLEPQEMHNIIEALAAKKH